MELINWNILRQPYNWLTVWLMLALAVGGLSLTGHPASEPATPDDA